MASPSTTRLHVTPLTPNLLATVLPASIRSSATDISFHSILTFPENSYGYLTLPTPEAEKFRKKMDGSMLKGKRFRVETARPPKRQRDENTNDEADPKAVSNKSSKKQKTEDNIIDGYELTDRQVKRGWTESTEAKKERRKGEKRKREEEKRKTKIQPKSKYSDKPECLFRTKVPPNRPAATDDKKSKKKKNSKESVVHEFANTISHPTFVRFGMEGVSPSATFEEGKGWVDDKGNLKEPASDRIRTDQYRPGQVPGAKEKRKPIKVPHPEDTQPPNPKGKATSSPKEATSESEDESEDWTSSSGGSSSDESTSDPESDDNSPSISSDESDVSESDTMEQKPAPSYKDNKPTVSIEAEKDQGVEDDEKINQDDSLGEATNEQPSTEVHPLEALFRRPPPDSAEPKPPLESSKQFSFFGNNDDIESEEEDLDATGPFTPFTTRDMQERGLRSAAPTPDTALASRHIQWNESEDEEDDIHNSPVPTSGKSDNEESGFAKWFWDNRGDNNRAWKKRRREAAKEERQRENRRKGMKGKS